MDTFKAYMLRKAYERIQKLGDKLAKIEPLIDWEAFTPIIQSLYHNKGPQGGRPNIDPVVMVKLLVLQQGYGLSDPELERRLWIASASRGSSASPRPCLTTPPSGS
jgi:IS5 family transposase